MRVQTADDAKRWLANKGGRWREQRVSGRVTVVASAKGMSRQSVAEAADTGGGTPEELLERALIAAVNDLAEATANLGA
jgi:hypothetical protein